MDKKQPEALRRSTAADGKTELFNLPGYPLMVRAVDFNRIHTESEMRRTALLDEMQKATPPAEQQAMESVLVDGVAYPTPAPVAGELLRLHLELRAATTEAAPVVQPGAVYANKPDSVAWLAEYGGDVFTAAQLLNFADRTHALRKQAAPKAAPGDVLDEALRERDDAEDFIDALLDEVLGHERPEWSSSYGHADALNDVQERMTALHKPAVDKAWGRFQSAKAAPQQEAQEPVAYVHVPHYTVEGKVRPVVSFEKYQQDYDDGIYSTRIPLYTAPQPAPAPLSEREEFERDWEKRHAPVPINGRTHDDGRYGDSSIQDAWESWQARAAIAAQGGK